MFMGRVYKITNTTNGKFYVGFTASSLEKRFARHKRNAKYGQDTYLYRAIRRNGESSFIIESVQEGATFEDECKWISDLKPAYNMTAGGEGGDTSASPNFRKGVAAYHARKSKESYATYGHAGKKHSENTKSEQSKIKKDFWDANPERKEKLKERVSGAGNPMFGKTPANAKIVTIDNTTYPSIVAATKSLGVKSIYIFRKLYKID
jgi:group I intron endonuclease